MHPCAQKVWREGFAPLLSTPGLEALAAALAGDDQALIQNATTFPPPLQALREWPVEKACALGLAGWKGDCLATIGAVEEFFARLCYQVDENLGEPAACRWFLTWFDETDRPVMRRELLAEVRAVLDQRRGKGAVA
jgi:hypothetical protein